MMNPVEAKSTFIDGLNRLNDSEIREYARISLELCNRSPKYCTGSVPVEALPVADLESILKMTSIIQSASAFEAPERDIQIKDRVHAASIFSSRLKNVDDVAFVAEISMMRPQDISGDQRCKLNKIIYKIMVESDIEEVADAYAFLMMEQIKQNNS